MWVCACVFDQYPCVYGFETLAWLNIGWKWWSGSEEERKKEGEEKERKNQEEEERGKKKKPVGAEVGLKKKERKNFFF